MVLLPASRVESSTVTVFLGGYANRPSVGSTRRRGGDTDVLARTPDGPDLARGRRSVRRRRAGCRRAPGTIPAALPAPLLSRGTARAGPGGSPGQTQQPGTQDHRADRLPGRPPPQAGAALRRRRRLGRRGGHGASCAGTWPSEWPTPTPCWSWTAAASPRRGTPPAAWPGSGAAGWARSRTARWASSWPTSRPGATPRWTGGCTCPRSGPRTPKRRQETHVPEAVTFQESWRIGLDLLDRSGPDVPFGWVAGDDEFGRASDFRAALRQRGLRYVLDVPCNTSIRDLGETPAPGRRLPPWRRVDAVGQGPAVLALASPGGRRRGQGSEGWCGRWRRGCRPRTRTAVSGRGAAGGHPHGGRGAAGLVHAVQCQRRAAAGVVEAHGRRHGVEELLQAGKGEVGLGPLRGAELGGLAPPHDAVAVGVVVLDPGEGSARGGKSRP